MDTALWLFTVAVSVHMIEEVVWLPAWSMDAGRWHIPVSRRAFVVATLIFLAVLWLVAFVALRGGPTSAGAYLVTGFTFVMILNLFVPHLGATVAQKQYAPGLATALLGTLPASLYLLSWAAQSATFELLPFVLVSAAVLLVAVIAWPLLLRFGLSVTRSGLR